MRRVFVTIVAVITMMLLASCDDNSEQAKLDKMREEASYIHNNVKAAENQMNSAVQARKDLENSLDKLR